ncbi:MAG TPA: histone deacetylase, partial [Methanosarcina sp.]|nr:histone deacetylase [Methanosarcina sp.]
MKLGLGRLRDVLKTGSGIAVEGEKEQAEGKSKIETEEARKTKIEETKPEISKGNEEITMELKKTGLEPKKEPLLPADRTGAEKTGLIFFPAFDWAISP